MESKEANDLNVLLDLEKGNYLLIREDSDRVDVNSIAGQITTMMNDSWNDHLTLKDDNHMPCCSALSRDFVSHSADDMISEGDSKVGLSDNSAGKKDKKKRSKKPPRPPRPPATSPLDAADQKLVHELSELAMLKRARIERMKALKKMKNSKPASPISNLVALVITVIFCLVILWQEEMMCVFFLFGLTSIIYRLADEMKHWVFSKHVANISFHGLPISSVRMHDHLISIHFYKKNGSVISLRNSSAAASNVETAMRLESHGESRRVTG